MRLNQSTKVISGKISKRIHRIGFRWLKNYHVLSFRGRKEGEFQSERRQRNLSLLPLPQKCPSSSPRAKISNSSRDRRGRVGENREWGKQERDCATVLRSGVQSKFPLDLSLEFMARLQSMLPAYPDNQINCVRLKRDRRFLLRSRFRSLYIIIDRIFFRIEKDFTLVILFIDNYREFSKVSRLPRVKWKETSIVERLLRIF